jgi:Tfp pilus assembly protein PilF
MISHPESSLETATSITSRLLWPGSLLLLSVVAYLNSFPAVFISDDLTIVVDNPLVSNPDLAAIFTTDYWGLNANSGLFRPLTILSFGVVHFFWGADATIHHFVNLVLHGLVSLLVFSAFQLYGFERKTAWLAAALFAVHPIHTEVLNEAVGRAELLATLSVLGVLWAWRKLSSPGIWLALPLIFLAGLLSKENAIILLGWLPVLVFYRWPSERECWRVKLVSFVLLCGTSLAWLAWRAWGVVRNSAADGYDQIYTPLAFLDPVDRLLTALKFQWLYLRKVVFPVDLQGVYSGQNFFQPVNGIFSAEGSLIVVATLVLLAGVAWLLWHRKPSGLGLVLYLIAIAPASNLFFVSGVTFAERLLYLPSIGFCLFLAVLLVRLSARIGSRWSLIVPVSCLIVLLAVTLLRNSDYRSAENLWQHDVQRDPQNVLAWMFLANAYAARNKTVAADNAFREMETRAPDFAEGLRSYAGFLLAQKRYDAAIERGLKVAGISTAVYPTNYLVLGQAYVAIGDYGNALRWLKKTPLPFRQYGAFWEYYGWALEGLGDGPGAIASYRRMGSYPEGSEIPLRLGTLLLQQGRADEASEVLAEVVRREPSSAAAWNSFGVSHALTGNMGRAREAFAEAVRLAPGVMKYRENLQRVDGQ